MTNQEEEERGGGVVNEVTFSSSAKDVKSDDTNDKSNNSSISKTEEDKDVNKKSSMELWKTAQNNVLLGNNMARQKVSLGNKIGTPARDLAPTNALRIIAMSVERALRQFGNPILLKEGENESESDSGSTTDNTTNNTTTNNDDGKYSASSELTASEQRKRRNNSIVEMTSLRFRASSNFLEAQPPFRCYDMCPSLFGDIRRAFGIQDIPYYAIVGLQHRRRESSYSVLSSKDAAGKSPSFFFLTSDQRFILKSCTELDVTMLCEILPDYRDYVVRQQESTNNGAAAACGTLLPRYLGLYQLTFTEDIPDVTLLVMVNFFASAHQIHAKFDLKGSTFNRVASEKERSKKNPVYKDNDWIHKGKKLTFPTEQMTTSIHTQLQMDTAFLSQHNLMDYSLLVGIHTISSNDPALEGGINENNGVISCSSEREVCYFGIIDILTKYRTFKLMETFFTGILLCRPNISCQHPNKYAQRFCDFSHEHVLSTDAEAEYTMSERNSTTN